jgi:hypothetical protein
MMTHFPKLLALLALLAFLASATTAEAQELEARRWNHLPVDTNFHGIGYGYVEGDLSFDPVLQIDDATVKLHNLGLRTIRTFDLFGLTARVDLLGAYQEGTWKGTLAGTQAQVSREGWGDPTVRFGINLYGAPAIEAKDFAEHRAAQKRSTVVGVAVAVQVPLGEYFDEKLINLGTNRFIIRPQIGVVHNRGKWGFEFTGSTWVYTDNDDFFGGRKLENKPFYTVQGHIEYHFVPKFWLAGGLAFGIGAESTVSGDHKDDRRENLVYSVSVGYSITRNFGVKLGYLGTSALARTGTDFDSLIMSATFFWPDTVLQKALGLGE